MTGAALLAVLAAGVAAAALASIVVPPTPRLAPRVRPYTLASRSGLGRGADAAAVAEPGTALSAGTLRRLVGPPVEELARALGRIVDQVGDDALLLRLRQAGLCQEVPEARRAQEYRIRQLGSAALATAVLGGATLLAGQPPARVLLAGVGGCVFGATRWRGRVDRAIEERRLRMQIELYTVNQLLAMHVRVGGGVVQAIGRVVERGRGEVVGELAEVLAAHRSGRRISAALEHAARVTPEPHASRTYKLLAGGAEYGADLAEGLRALSEDIRGQRGEMLKRAATRRRAAMLVPIIAVLAPIMLLFVAAPLPSIVFGGR
ncbi:MAG TPA: type II secretion system F family protein [Egibacteraceae bacterium]|nr:type II secretion system F family protein [Egibacteraceae bacterium]